MDIETLTNHISNLGKSYFDNACKIVLRDVFDLNAINVDGQNDGGTDYVNFTASGERTNVAYQVTTQKSAIKLKAYNDAKKAIDKLDVKRFYFLTTYILDETETRKLENKITTELHIATTCLSSRNIAGLLLSENLLDKFLDETNYPLPRGHVASFDYKEMALHSYTLISDDALQLKSGIYDDTILLVLSQNGPVAEEELLKKTQDFLGLEAIKLDVLKKRIGALFGKSKIQRTADGTIELEAGTKKELDGRKSLYEIELANLSSAQVDLLRTEFNTDWTLDDSRKAAIWIANSFISDQIKNLKEAKASIVSNNLFHIEKEGLEKLRSFLTSEKKLDSKSIDSLVAKLLDNASNHPLITKISRATVYLALEGANPINSAKALGANRWSDFNILVEPTVAIPYSCSQLYQGAVNRYFDLSIKSLKRAQSLGARLFIPYFYINECAGHLLKARKYDSILLNPDELIFSNNAFVANYYALKKQGIEVPPSFLDYLSSFSSAIRIERQDIKAWVRAIMIDIQSILGKAGVDFIEVPFYTHDDCIHFETEYMYYLHDNNIEKRPHLINHDIYALQFTNDNIIRNKEHWIILTFDRSMIAISKSNKYNGWITTPFKFLDLTESTRPLSESQMVSLVHSVASFSEKTLAAGARIIDRVITYAAPKMQNWEFKAEIERFKSELIQNINLDKPDIAIEIDTKTDTFLKEHGISLVTNIEETDD